MPTMKIQLNVHTLTPTSPRGGANTPTPGQTATASPVATVTATQNPRQSPTPTAAQTITATPAPTETAVPGPSPTATTPAGAMPLRLVPIGASYQADTLRAFSIEAIAGSSDQVVALRVLPITYASNAFNISPSERQSNLALAQNRAAELAGACNSLVMAPLSYTATVIDIQVRNDAFDPVKVAQLDTAVDGIFIVPTPIEKYGSRSRGSRIHRIRTRTGVTTDAPIPPASRALGST